MKILSAQGGRSDNSSSEFPVARLSCQNLLPQPHSYGFRFHHKSIHLYSEVLQPQDRIPMAMGTRPATMNVVGSVHQHRAIELKALVSSLDCSVS